MIFYDYFRAVCSSLHLPFHLWLVCLHVCARLCACGCVRARVQQNTSRNERISPNSCTILNLLLLKTVTTTNILLNCSLVSSIYKSCICVRLYNVIVAWTIFHKSRQTCSSLGSKIFPFCTHLNVSYF